MKKNKKIYILGGGISGLSACNFLLKKNIFNTILEKENKLGGLLRPIKIKNYTFDRAVHLSFAKEKEVREVFDQTDYITHQPISYNWDKNIWIKHPVQNNLKPLNFLKKLRLIFSLLSGFFRPSAKVFNYRKWLLNSYGSFFAESYPIKYTKKYWGYEPEKLSTSWLGPRMNKVNLIDIFRGAFLNTKNNTYYVKEMRYPKKGSYYKFLEPLIKNSNSKLNKLITSINTKEKIIIVNDNEVYSYDYIINTLPLPYLCQITEDLPSDLKLKSRELEASQIELISIGFNKFIDIKSLWFYIYDEDIYASRCYSPSLKNKNSAPANYSSIQFEIYKNKLSRIYTKKQLIDNCIKALEKWGMATKDDISFTKYDFIENGNVIFKLGTEDIRDELINWFKKKGIVPAGRFGEWKYLWSNQSYISGMNAAREIIRMT